MINLKALKKQELLDGIKLNIEGIDIEVFGILHGITGGTNQEYISLVNRTIESVNGINYCEKSMKKIYKNLDIDVQDWLVFKDLEAFNFAFKSMVNPVFVFNLFKIPLIETFTKKSKFGEDDIYKIGDIGGDSRFHDINPHDRRIMAGFPDAHDYMKLNFLRRHSLSRKKISFSDPDWKWLEYIEPSANIPYRSIHMLEFALQHAKDNGFEKINLFVGEIHNSDIEWYAENRQNLPSWLLDDANYIKYIAAKSSQDPLLVKKRQIKYYSLLSVGAAIPIMTYISIINYLLG